MRKYLSLLGLCAALACFQAPAQEGGGMLPAIAYQQSSVQAAQEARSMGEQALALPPLSVSLVGMPVLRPGDQSAYLPTLRSALAERGFAPYQPVVAQAPFHGNPAPAYSEAAGYYAFSEFPEVAPATLAWDATVYDDHVLQAVYTAQRHYGISEDGIAGPELYQVLSRDGRQLGQALLQWSDRIDQLAREARSQGHSKLVLVNIPSYTLKAIDLVSGQTVVETRVIVGKPGRRTPVFTTNIINLKYNPDWTPPPSLAAQGKRYTRPGPNNPLGRIRFSTDNNLNIYLHHTNEPDLFDRKVRALSSGCVRVEAWDKLAAFLADSGLEHIHDQVASGRTFFEKTTRVPVVMTYSLADVQGGQASLNPDVYHRLP